MTRETNFWRRQFVGNPTDMQWGFDFLFGIGLPTLCVLFDPVVFWTASGDSLLNGFQPAALWTILLGALTLLIWLVTHRLAALFVGMFAVCAIFAVALGLLLLPLSIVGTLFAGIGLLGLVPFATAFVFARNAYRAWAAVRQDRVTKFVAMNLILGLELVPVTAYAFHAWHRHESAQAVIAIQSEDPNDDATAIRFLRWCSFDRRFEVLARQHLQETDLARRIRIGLAYLELTGIDLEGDEPPYWLND